MDEVMENAVLKAVQKKFPVCNVLDARTYNGKEVSEKCSDAPKTVEVSLGKKKFEIELCTGSFNVYVLNIKEIV